MNTITPATQARQTALAVLGDRKVSGRFSRLKNAPLKWDAERSYAIQLIEKSDQLQEALRDNPQSLVNAMLDIATYGVSLSPTLSHAYLIPQRVNGIQTVTAIISYRGLEAQVLKSGTVKAIQTELVYSNDRFRRGQGPHGPFVEFEMARSNRGLLEGGFCWSMNATGIPHVEWMDVKELLGCERAAELKQKKKPITWTGPFKAEMQKKCIVRRASKHWVIADHLVKAFEQMDRIEPMTFDALEADPQMAEAIVVITNEHKAEIVKAVTDKGFDPEHVTTWLTMQAKAWGHSGIEKYPDEHWERLKTALIERADKITAARAGKAA